MTTKFHITRAGRIEPCGARVRACPLGEANHYASLTEAVAASMTPQVSFQRGKFTAKTAPLDLRRYFITDEDDDGNETVWFSSRSAYHGLIGGELGDDFAKAIAEYPVGLTLRDGIKRLADADFENDDAWQASDERRIMATEVPTLLARLEDQAEESAIYRQLHD